MKEKRQAMILQLIASRSIETQEELTTLLIENGFAATQATVSRDIKELRLVKAHAPDGKNRYALNQVDREASRTRHLRIFVECVQGIDVANNLMVIRTLPGSAQAAAGTLDGMQLPEVLGCIAGDDTILVVLRDDQVAATLRNQLQMMLG